MFEPLVSTSFGGGLNFSTHPAALRPDEWTWSEGFLARDGYAEVLPGYTLVVDSSWLTGTYLPIGIAQNIFESTKAAVIGLVDSSGLIKLFKMDAAGNRTEITWDGVGTAPRGAPFGIMQAAFLEGFMVLNFGTVGLANPSIIRWDGGATYTAIQVSPVLKADFLISFGGHLIAARTEIDETGKRTIKVSDANSTTVWTPAVSNSADSVVLADALSGITGLASAQGNVAFAFTRTQTYGIIPTGGIPAFTIQTLAQRGCREVPPNTDSTAIARQLLGVTPEGVVFRGDDDLYIMGGEGIASKVFGFLTKGEIQTPGTAEPPQYQWDGDHGSLIVPVHSVDECFMRFHARTGAWSLQAPPVAAGSIRRHAVLADNNGNAATGYQRHWFTDSLGQVFVASAANTPAGGEFVDTKDFSLVAPTEDDYTGLVKVDWEPLTNATTDAITVQIATHNDLSRALLGTPGLETQQLSFTTAGTLTGGASEMPLRGRGKYTRLRFLVASGRVRIRGFTLLAERAGQHVT